MYSWSVGKNYLLLVICVYCKNFVSCCLRLVNTAVENAVDTATKDFSPTAKAAKDVAAGAVLFCAIISVIMGFFLFFDADRISKTLYCIFSKPHILIPCLIIGIFDICFIIWGDKLLIKKKK